MPNDYIRRMPWFNGNKDISIESHLDILWDYMESRGANNEDVYMRALGESLQGDVQLWFDHLAPGSVTGYDMFTDFTTILSEPIMDMNLEVSPSQSHIAM